jgi:capsular exopolysaccharide synthesis family protein
MSKLFNQAQKAQDWELREGTSNKLDLEGMMQSVKETISTADAVGTDLSSQRLDGCRKIHLPRSSNSRVIFSGNVMTTTMATESYRALRTRLLRMQETQGLHSIVLSSALPGEGKTLTSMNLALVCAQLKDLRVLLIDGDLRSHGLTRLMGEPPGPGLSDVLAGDVPFESAIVATDQPNLYVLAAGSSDTPPAELFAGSRWKELLGWAAETFKVVLVDSPPILTLADFELISAPCDGVLVVVRALQTRRELLKKASAQVDAKKFLGLVFNGSVATSRDSCHHADYYGNGNGNQK